MGGQYSESAPVKYTAGNSIPPEHYEDHESCHHRRR
jgi:hypothetical protein